MLKSINQKIHVEGIFCDLAKNSDCVNHEIFFSKLHFYGIQGTVTKWFKSYVTDRKQKVEIKSPNNTQNFFSDWTIIEHSSSSRVNSRALVFIICINNLFPTTNTLLKPTIFTDDSSVILSNKNFDDFCIISNTVLSRMSKWFTASKLP
jgi:hypothetical protein